MAKEIKAPVTNDQLLKASIRKKKDRLDKVREEIESLDSKALRIQQKVEAKFKEVILPFQQEQEAAVLAHKIAAEKIEAKRQSAIKKLNEILGDDVKRADELKKEERKLERRLGELALALSGEKLPPDEDEVPASAVEVVDSSDDDEEESESAAEESSSDDFDIDE